ncbi:hypothetical protein B0H10DRAFT_1949527 [Mycena sp. CBHHK59/15]|nr:hypothetical protein B0H10DRAFT_1949527 [Mycena sp. CBHHK59/15]
MHTGAKGALSSRAGYCVLTGSRSIPTLRYPTTAPYLDVSLPFFHSPSRLPRRITPVTCRIGARLQVDTDIPGPVRIQSHRACPCSCSAHVIHFHATHHVLLEVLLWTSTDTWSCVTPSSGLTFYVPQLVVVTLGCIIDGRPERKYLSSEHYRPL